MGGIRAFIAIELSEELRERVRATIEDLKKSVGSVRGLGWVKPGNVHITLKFLGEIDPSQVDAVASVIEEASKATPPFTVEASGIGAFPNPRSPRVVWMGIAESDAMKELQGRIDDGCGRIGFERDGRPFRPHLTLCRVKNPAAARSVAKAVDKAAPDNETAFTADSVVLFKSTLSPKGAEYSVLRRIPLKTTE